jgi:type IV pilus assembly protein PilB
MLTDLQLTPQDIDGKQFFHGRGCDHCNNTGYRARVGLFELMVMNDELRDMIMRNASTDELRQRARAYGMVSLRDVGLEAVYAGDTSLEEIIRETITEG